MEQDKRHFATSKKLHTDFLEEKYGTIIADVLRHDNVEEIGSGQDRVREVKMVDNLGIVRTYALTLLTYDKHDKKILHIDEQIRNGGLIGKTFRDNGYIVKKNVIDVSIIDIPQWLQDDFHDTHTQAKARITEFYAKAQDSYATPVVYGIVYEIYSPDFRNPEDGINTIDLAQINPLIEQLESSGIAKDTIWGRLDQAGDPHAWQGLEHHYALAKHNDNNAKVVDMLRHKFYNYITNK